MNRRKKIVIAVICGLVLAGLFFEKTESRWAWAAGEEDTAGGGTGNTGGTGEDATGGGTGNTGQYDSGGSVGELSAEMVSGNDADITLSGVDVLGDQAGGEITVSFNATGNKNGKKHYEVENIEKVYPVLNEAFPFVTNDEAYRVTAGAGSSVGCSYRFTARDNLETSYYTISYIVIYSRRATDGKTAVYENEYYLTKSITVRINAIPKPTSTPEPEEPKAETAQDADIFLEMAGSPYGSYSGDCRVAFTARSSRYKITSVVPVISDNFPFESTSDAYKVVQSAGTKKLACRYGFHVKDNVSSGYQGVTFRISYLKNGQVLTEDKVVQVALQGKQKKKPAVKKEQGKTSTPRVMVARYSTDVKRVMPNRQFQLTLHIKNNADQAVYNLKFTISTEDGEFLPISGASTAYLDRIAAKSIANLPFRMKSSASLGAKSYPIKVKIEYEDGKANAYSSEDDVSIPVSVPDRISLTDMMPPESLCVGDTGDFSFSINNLGKASLGNVSARCIGKDFSCEEFFIGDIAAGATGYANLVLEGEKVTPESSSGVCKIVIKYESASGENKRYVEETNVYVSEMTDDLEETGEEDMKESEKPGIPLAGKVAAAVIALVAVMLVARHILRKRRLKKEEEMIDDELL